MLNCTLLRSLSLLLYGTLVVGAAACTRSSSQNQPQSIVIPSPVPAVDVTASNPVETPSPQVSSQADVYKQALEKANSAQNLGRSALSEDDWNLVSTRWQQAIELIKELPASSPYQPMAKAKLREFEKSFAVARKRANQAKLATEQTALGKLGGTTPLNVTSAVTSPSGGGKLFVAQIKRRAAGTPVIDVTFNGNQTFEMIVDTGASSTVITQPMADALGVRIIGKTKVNTASQAGVEVPLAFVNSISVGEATVKEVIVAIGNNALDIGLLGHDFFSDFDVTVKQDVVEFRKR